MVVYRTITSESESGKTLLPSFHLQGIYSGVVGADLNIDFYAINNDKNILFKNVKLCTICLSKMKMLAELHITNTIPKYSVHCKNK